MTPPPTGTARRPKRKTPHFAVYTLLLAGSAAFFALVSYHKATDGPDWRTVARAQVQAYRQANHRAQLLKTVRSDTPKTPHDGGKSKI